MKTKKNVEKKHSQSKETKHTEKLRIFYLAALVALIILMQHVIQNY